MIHAQEAHVHDDDLNELVHVHTWKDKCFEFAHFDDDELGAAIRQVHTTCAGLTPEELRTRAGLMDGERCTPIQEVTCREPND